MRNQNNAKNILHYSHSPYLKMKFVKKPIKLKRKLLRNL